MPIRHLIALLVVAVISLAANAHGLCNGRWTVTLTSDSGRTATLKVAIRHCPGLRHSAFCTGRYRCEGDACPSRKGHFQAEPEYLYPTGWFLSDANILPLHHNTGGAVDSCFLAHSPRSGDQYYCYARVPAPRPAIDHGWFRCETVVAACGKLRCSGPSI
jgi:hypothetical protein